MQIVNQLLKSGSFLPFFTCIKREPLSCVKYKSKRMLNQVNRPDKKIRRDCGLQTAAVDKLLEPTMSCTTLPGANAYTT